MGKIQIPTIKVDDVEADQKPTELISSDGSVPYDVEGYGVEPESSKMELPEERSLTFVMSDSNDGASRPYMKARLSHRLSSRSSQTSRPNMEADQKPTGSTNSSDGSVPPDVEDYGMDSESSEIELPDMEADQKPTGSTNSSDGSVPPDVKARLAHSVPRISSITLRPNMEADQKPTGSTNSSDGSVPPDVLTQAYWILKKFLGF